MLEFGQNAIVLVGLGLLVFVCLDVVVRVGVLGVVFWNR